MAFEKRDWWWIVGMTIVCSSFVDKRGWSEPWTAVLGAVIGACLGFLISRLTRRSRSR